MKKIIVLASLLTATIAAITQEPIKAKANDPYNLIGTGVSVIYNSDKDGGDYAWIAYDKLNTYFSSQMSYINQVKKYVIIGFDAPQIAEIERMGFYVTYKEPNFIHRIGNWVGSIFGNPPTFGTTKTDSVLVKASTKYTFYHRRNGMESVLDFIPGKDASDYEFTAIGKVSDLIETEQRFKTDFNNSPNTNDTRIKEFNVTGGFYWNFNHNDSLNDSTKSFTNRKYYAIIPFDWTEEIQPESIKAYDIFGELIDDGLDEDGNAHVDPITEDYYIDLTVGRDVGVAINGTNARVTRIEISGYDDVNDTGVLIQNSNFDYATQSTTNVVQQKLFVGNATYNANWTITNENRYIFIKFDGELNEANKIKVRVFYRNDNAKQSWIIRVTDADGNFLPPPYETVPTMRPQNGDDRWERILTLLGVGILGLVALYGISKLFEILANVKRAVS